ncbi:Na+/H+ antiporter subunit E [Palleronia sp. LCG004]|uniref:Na+/H+ antiporter subunit E n=1 Tax=Palleronia sp. LCG004 TaxID=3079304 RepID=UPI00294359D3|nr:Na+/H+ antiporter subunit E [Palleronia sp. LCG004]WOI56309.1 Na+/H+ antiporter subunit E [Palleronia sp. LCG004]
MIARILPHPYLTLLLVVVWCMLNSSIGLGTIVFGTIVALLIPILTAAYWPDRPRIVRPFKLAFYVLVVIWEILKANIQVAIIVLFKSNRQMKSNWVVVPLDLKSPEAITVLAGTITLTPGTVSADLSDDGYSLLVHALDAPEPDVVRDDIKNRFERRLKEIFE